MGRFFAGIARRLGIWVIAGSFHEAGPDPEHTWNTSLVFDRAGALAASYRKIHLYDVEIPGRVSYRESAKVAPGDQPVVVDVEGLRVGLSICYDLRFPELYRQLATRWRRRAPGGAGRVHDAHRAGPLGGSAPGPGDREPVLRGGGRPDR